MPAAVPDDPGACVSLGVQQAAAREMAQHGFPALGCNKRLAVVGDIARHDPGQAGDGPQRDGHQGVQQHGAAGQQQQARKQPQQGGLQGLLPAQEGEDLDGSPSAESAGLLAKNVHG